MSDMDVRLQLTADASGLVGQLRLSQAEMGQLATATKATSAAFDAGKASGAQYTAMASQLRAALDPMFAVQQRFDQELERAEQLMKLGAISTREYAAAQKLANDNLRAGHAAVMQSTGAAAEHTKNLNLQRAGYQQLGFQMQDVFASYASGSKLSTIFAQQSGQMASAIAMIGQAGEGAKGKLGAFASFIGGPWGIAIGIGVSVLGALLVHLDAAKKKTADAADANQTLAEKLDLTKNSYDAVIKATREYNAEQSRSRQLTLDMAAAVALQTVKNIELAKSKLAVLQTQLREEENSPALRGYTRDDGTVVAGKDSFRMAQVRSQIADVRKELTDLGTTATNSVNAIAVEMAKIQTDPQYAIEVRFKRLADEARAANLPLGQLTQRYAELNRQKQAALDAERASHRRPSAASSGLSGREINSAEARTIAQTAGFQVNSADRPSWIKDERPGGGSSQERLYNQWVAAGRPSDNPTARPGTSAHERGNALDIQFGKDVSRASIRKAFSDEGVRLTKVFKERGHFHVEWSTTGADRVLRQVEQVDDFGKRAANSIAQISAQFDAQPRLIDAAAKSTRDLDAIIAELRDKQPPGFEALIDSAEQAKVVVAEGLVRPWQDYLQSSREGVEIDRLMLAGKTDQAHALQVILGLQAKMGPLGAEQLQTVLATVQAERQRGMVLRDQQALIQDNVAAVHDMRGALQQTVAGMLQGRFSVQSILQSIGSGWVQMTSNRIVEAMFGDTLRALEDQASGQDKVDAAGQAMATAMSRGTSAVTSLADTIIAAIARIEGAPAAGAVGVGTGGGSWLERTMTEWAGIDMRQSPSDGGEIVVNGGTGGRGSAAKLPESILTDMVTRIVGVFGIKVPPALASVVKSSLGTLEARLPEVMAGAMTGSAASKLILGSNSNSAGSAIGGVLGQAAGKALTKGMTGLLGSLGGPLGAIAGGVLGSLIGGLFASKPHGTATITSTTDKAQVSGSTSEIASGLNQMSTGVQGALKQIADRLGADVGSFAVSIGQYKDYYQVSSVANDPNLGKTYFGQKSPNALYDGKDASAAVAAAIQNAIADGGVKGLSAKVEKALKSSPDIDVALAEALKVQAVELAVGGLGAQLEKQFKDFERQAADRLRIARQYGFDVVKMEERNAADRLALTRKLEAEQTGSLQSLIDSMTSGSLFEGNILDQRQAVLDQIAAAKVDANAGVEGAADKLAGLLEQLNSISRDAYGTTGGFAADRATILDDARATIATANQRIADAAKGSDPALETTNAALNEVNDQIAALNVRTGDVTALLAQLVAQGGTSDFSSLATLASTGKLTGA